MSTATIREPRTRAPAGRDAHLETSPALRVRARLSQWRLDHEIAAGASFDAHPACALRASQLVQPRVRAEIAASLRSIIATAEAPFGRRPWTASLVQRHAVLDARQAIFDLADRLDTEGPVNPRGVAQARVLISDGALSPLFNGALTQSVLEAAWAALAALDE